MKDRIVQHANRYKLTPVSGDVYDLTPEPGIVTEPGTDLNKANLLKDTTAALYPELPANPTPNDVFAAIPNRIKYDLLLSATTTATVTQVDLSLSAITLSDYSEIVLTYAAIPLSAGGTTLQMRVNDITSSSYYVNSGSSNVNTSWPLGQFQDQDASGGYNCGVVKFNILNTVKLSATGDTVYRYNSPAGFFKASYPFDILSSALAPASFNKINIFSSSANGIAAGSKFLVYGVKK